MTTKGAAKPRRRSGFRSIVWLLLVAFTLQSFITQTHVHGVDTSARVNTPAAHHTTPSRNDATRCPFCQAIIHSGTFFAPTAPDLLLPIMLATAAAPSVVSGVIERASARPWQSRAPPRI